MRTKSHVALYARDSVSVRKGLFPLAGRRLTGNVGQRMSHRILALLAFAAAGCSHVSKSSLASNVVGVYEGRDVVDTEERLTLSADRTFTYDFMPLGETGQSYGGRWESKGGVVILTGKLESGEEEDFPLKIGSEKGVQADIHLGQSSASASHHDRPEICC